MPKRIIYIHGRAEKPDCNSLKLLTLKALDHGLSRVGAFRGDIPLDMAFYGDINNAFTWASKQDPEPKYEKDFLNKWAWKYEKTDSYTESPNYHYSAIKQDKKEFNEFKKLYKNNSYLDNLADIFSPIASFFGFSDNLMNHFLPDLGAYFEIRAVGSMIRQRLQAILIPALEKGDDVCLIAHSLGSAVAYDVLWKLSRMSEYKYLFNQKVSLFITIGSPLGDYSIRSQLKDYNEPEDGKYPTNINKWINFAAKDDTVSRDEKLSDNFEGMPRKGLVPGGITDHEIYNFYVNRKGVLNPHKVLGYLDNQYVAKEIGGWLES